MARRGRNSIWEQLRESTEGPTVTISIPREWAEQLMQSLMQGLEIEGGEEDGMGVDDPEADDAIPGMDDDSDELDFSGEDNDEPELAAGDDSEDDDSDDDDDDDDETDEAADYGHSGGNPSGLRTKTAFGESAFARRGRSTRRK